MISVVASIQKENYKTQIVSGEKTVIADEPIDMGGKNLGFTPSELLASSLASCTAITLRMYADRKKWELDEAMINVDFENQPGIAANMVMNIRLFGNLDEKQRERLVEIAHKCPVHKLLEESISIDVNLKD